MGKKVTAIKRFASWVAAVAWLAILAFLTLQAGDDTSSLSLSIARWLAAILKQINRYEVSTFTLNMALRKTAHVVIFFVLGLLTANVIRTTFTKLKSGLVCAAAGTVCVIIAVSCEYSKTFIPGRHCQWDEATIDIAAALAGIILFIALINFKQRRQVSNTR
jgi:VanZ family protein